ncbi:MAG: hypothetical protein IKJ19_06930 [Clostridia bacterium]|nr:hypothetical protein [Clostridia bacterium]
MLNKLDKRFFVKLATFFESERVLVSLDKIEGIASRFLRENENVEVLLKRLQKAGYIELIFTDKRGAPFVYMVMLKSGADFLREKKNRKKEVGLKIILAFLSATITFIFGKILYAFFS